MRLLDVFSMSSYCPKWNSDEVTIGKAHPIFFRNHLERHEPKKKQSFDVNAFNKIQVEETRKPKKSIKQKEKERKMKLIHGAQADERISKWMKSLERPENSLNMKNFDVTDSNDQSNRQSDLSEKETVNFDLVNFDAVDAGDSEALFHNLGIEKKKNPENDEMIFSSPEDLKRMNISFKDKRRELIQFIKMDPFGRIVFDQPRFQSRKQFTDMNVLGSVAALENCPIVI